jgi:outer membrane protein assembly factor BamB
MLEGASQWYLAVRAVDHAGNLAEDVFRVGPFKLGEEVDLIMVQVDHPIYNGLGGDPFISSVHQFDLAGVNTYRIRGQGQDNTREYSRPFSLTGLRDGAYRIDLSGTLQVQTMNVVMDSTAPETVLHVGKPSHSGGTGSVTSAAPLSLEVQDGTGSGVEQTFYRILGPGHDTGWLLYKSPFRLSGLPDGLYKVEFYSTDRAGNVEPTRSSALSLDNTAPSASIAGPAPGANLGGDVLFEAVASDAGVGVSSVDFSIVLESGTQTGFEDMAATFNLKSGRWQLGFDTEQLGDGRYMVSARTQDHLGNDRQAAASALYDVDNPSASGGWPTYRFDSSHIASTQDPPSETSVLWTHTSSTPIASAPLVVGDMVIFHTGGLARAVDVHTGVTLWEREIFRGNGGPAKGIGQAGGRLYFGSSEYIYTLGFVHCLDAATGELLWRFESTPGRVETAPVVSGGTVYFGTLDGYLYALDAETGHFLWRFNASSPILSSPAASENLVCFGTESGNAYALEVSPLHQGGYRLAWSYNAGGAIQMTPLLHEGKVYFSSRDGVLHGLDADTGSPVFELLVGSRLTNDLAIDGNHLYVAQAYYGTKVLALDLGKTTETGEVEKSQGLLWSTTLPKGPNALGSPVIAGGKLLITAQHAKGLYGLDTESGGLEWTHLVQGNPADLAVADGRVFLPAGNELICIGAPYPDSAHTYRIESGQASHLVVLVTNSTPSAFVASPETDSLRYRVDGIGGASGWSELQVPREITRDAPRVLIDGKPTDPSIAQNATHISIRFTYGPGQRSVEVQGLSLAEPPSPPSYQSLGDHWPTFRSTSQQAGTVSTPPLDRNDTLWTHTLPSSHYVRSEPIVAGEALYFHDGNTVYAIDKTTSDHLWTRENLFTGYGSLAYGFAQADDRLYLGSSNYIYGRGVLYCLNATTGETLWEYDSSPSRIETSPLVYRGTVYFGSVDGYLYALDATTGDYLWRFNASSPVMSSPGAWGDLICFGTDGGTVYALGAAQGQVLWSFEVGASVQSPVVVGGDAVYLSTNQGVIYALGAQAGEFLWRYELFSTWPLTNSMSLMENVLFLTAPGYGTKVYALRIDMPHGNHTEADPESRLWSTSLPGNPNNLASPALSGDRLVVPVPRQQMVYVLDAATGRIIWSKDLGSEITGGPAVSDGRILVGAREELHALGGQYPPAPVPEGGGAMLLLLLLLILIPRKLSRPGIR